MKRIVLVLFWIFTATVLCSAQTTFYFPQIADGIQSDGITWKTTIFITNPAAAGSSNSNVTITFTSQQGAPLNISFDGTGFTSSGNTVTFSISGAQTRKLVSTATGALRVGFATVSASAPVTGTAVFSEFTAGGGLISEAGVPSASASLIQAIFVDTQSGFDTGVAYANPTSTPATISLQLLSSQGVAVVASTQRSLAGNQHNSAFVSQLFSAPPFAGTMQITSSAPLAAIALRFSPSGLFTTLPPIPIAALIYPALQWLEARQWITPFTSVAKLLAGLQLTIG